MKISTRILISLILSLILLGACIIGIAYNNTQSNAKMFIKEYEKSAFSFHENELKTLMDVVQQTASGIYRDQKAKGSSDDEIKKAILSKLDVLRFFNDKSGYIFVYTHEGTNILTPTNRALQG